MIESFLAIPLMILEIIAAEFVFATLLQRKRLFWLKIIGCATMCIEVSFIILLLYHQITDTVFVYGQAKNLGDSVFKVVFYIFCFIMTIVCMALCYKGNLYTILFYCSGGYAMQHLAVKLAELLKLFFLFDNMFVFYLFEIPICAIVYFCIYFLFVRGRTVIEKTQEIRNKVFLSLCVLLICIALSRITTDIAGRDAIAIVAEALYAILSCILVVSILFAITEKEKMKNEAFTMSQLLHREREQFKLSQESIKLINIKCHDLKKQINALRNGVSEAQISELEEAVMIYNSAIKTGNDVLDIIFTEKSLFCEKNHIRMTCAVNGADIAFMDDMDVYSVFSNAMSNAIESVSAVQDDHRRSISVNMQRIGEILSIHIENNFEGKICFDNGIPTTSKNKDYHGFGMMSMARIAKKYGGHMSVTAEDHKFCLDFIFPVREKVK
jgi:hypothetical protein